MKPSYLSFYNKYSLGTVLILMKDAIFCKSPIRRLSLANRLRDYIAVAGDPSLQALHAKLNQFLFDSINNWKSYDYGEGYFYQGLGGLHITGLRDTDSRIKFMELAEEVQGRRVLEVGCNAGFIAVSIAPRCKEIVAFDINPFLLSIAEEVRTYLGIANCHFMCTAFEDLVIAEKFDVVLSFANHSTYDKNTTQSVQSYFRQCWELLKPDGIFLFESHPPEHEGEGFKEVLRIIDHYFEIKKHVVHTKGTFLDQNRHFIKSIRRKVVQDLGRWQEGLNGTN